MNETGFDRVTSALRAHGCRIVQNGHKATSTCPAHDDSNPSLSVTRSADRALVWCHSGCSTRDVTDAIGLSLGDLYDERAVSYRYDDGREVRRYYDNGRKRFAQTNAGPTAVLYHLAQLTAVTPGQGTWVFLVEGEADVHAIEAEGGVATTAPQGSDSFHKADVSPLQGHTVVVVVDRDDAGQKWAAQVAQALTGVADKFRFVRAREGKDASDHIAAGYGLTDFEVYQPDTIKAPIVTEFRKTFVTRSGLRDLPPVQPLIEGVMSKRSAVVLVGATGAGKSFLALAWACCVGTGIPWLGRAVERTRVLYVVGEGASGLNQRITAWEGAWGQQVADTDVLFSVKPASLLRDNVWQEVTAEARAEQVGLIVLDTFSSLYPDADETKDAAAVTRRLSDLTSDINGTAVLVHHPGWGDPERTRGGYQLTANVDEVLLLRGNAKDPHLSMERLKAKDDAVGSPVHLLRKPSRGSCIIEGRTDAEAVADAGGDAEAIVRTVFHGSVSFSRADIIRQINIARGDDEKSNKPYKYVGQLIDAGVIARDGGTNGRPLFRLVPRIAEDSAPGFAAGLEPEDPFG